jgi:hypothetical protein
MSTPNSKPSKRWAGFLGLVVLLCQPIAAFAAAIGVTDNGSTVVVTTNAGLVYTINEQY